MPTISSINNSAHTPTGRRLAVLAATAGLAVTLSACGSNDTSTGSEAGASSPSAAATVNGIATAHNDADVTFINSMTPHHTGAVQMAEMAVERATNPQVKELAGTIVQAQGPEQQKMTDMAEAWGVPTPAADPSMSDGGHGSGHGSMPSTMPSAGSSGMSMDEMSTMMAEDMAALEAASGAAFDREFLTRMIAHHQSALPMAQTEVAQGSNPQAKQLAQEIIDAQTAEISRMQELLPAV